MKNALQCKGRISSAKSECVLNGTGLKTKAQFVRRGLFCFLAIFAGAMLVGASNLHAEIIYTAKKGDSLTGIAKHHGVSLSALAARNHLRTTDQLLIGQHLIIPGSSATPAKGSSGLATDLKGKLDRITVSKRWKNIVVHHSATTLDTLSSMDRYHRNERHMENGLAYHFVIGNGVRTKDGEIYIGRRWSKQLDGGHLSSVAMNRTSIGICLIGDFNKRAPSEKQLNALRELISYLMNRCDLDKSTVQTHRQINVRPTQCPGAKFPVQKFMATLP
jgi:LysM repeat protein